MVSDFVNLRMTVSSASQYSVRVEDAGLVKQVITDCVLDIQQWSLVV